MAGGVPYSLTVLKLPTRDSLTDEQFHAMMEKGYNQAQSAEGLSVDEAFTKIREGIWVYSISMSILFGVIFCKALESYAGIGVGSCFGIALGVFTFVMFRAYRKKVIFVQERNKWKKKQ